MEKYRAFPGKNMVCRCRGFCSGDCNRVAFVGNGEPESERAFSLS